MCALRLRRGIAWYDSCLKAAPIKTKICTSVSILSVADVIRQALERRSPALPAPPAKRTPQPPRELPETAQVDGRWDFQRTLRMSLWGCTGHPLVIHHWMNVMERWHGSLPATAPKLQMVRLAARKVCVDQFTASPVFLGSFLCFTTLLEGKGIDGCRAKIKSDWWTMVKFGWSTWFVVSGPILSVWLVLCGPSCLNGCARMPFSGTLHYICCVSTHAAPTYSSCTIADTSMVVGWLPAEACQFTGVCSIS